MTAASAPKTWHVGNWGVWGWVETGLKIAAAIVGIIAFAATASETLLVMGGNPRLAAVILLALLTLGSIGQFFIRFTQREIISLVFGLINALGHLGLLVAFLRVTDAPVLGAVFAALHVLGNLAKWQFLRTTGYTEGGAKPQQMQMVNWALIAFYAVFGVLTLI